MTRQHRVVGLVRGEKCVALPELIPNGRGLARAGCFARAQQPPRFPLPPSPRCCSNERRLCSERRGQLAWPSGPSMASSVASSAHVSGCGGRTTCTTRPQQAGSREPWRRSSPAAPLKWWARQCWPRAHAALCLPWSIAAQVAEVVASRRHSPGDRINPWLPVPQLANYTRPRGSLCDYNCALPHRGHFAVFTTMDCAFPHRGHLGLCSGLYTFSERAAQLPVWVTLRHAVSSHVPLSDGVVPYPDEVTFRFVREP